MLGYLILLFTIVPAIELAVLIKVGTVIGTMNTISLIIITGVVGGTLARYQGLMVLMKIQDSLNRGIMPSAELLDGLMILVGGVLLLTPGFVTDTLGILLLIPWTRSVVKWLVRQKFQAMMDRGQVVHFGTFSGGGRRFGDYDDIDMN